MRPDWTRPLRESTNLIDLSTNICYDEYVEREINSFLRSITFSPHDVANEVNIYNSISKYHNNIPLDNITLGFGLGELYGRIVDIFQYHRFAIHTPTWEFAPVACKIRDVSYTEIRDINAPSSASILYVANPSGITGRVLTKYTLQGLANKYTLIIIDESYGEYSTINSSMINSINTHNIIVLKSLSKSLGVAGMRIGYALANKNLTNMMQERRPSSVSTTIASLLAPKLFSLIPSHVQRMIETRTWLTNRYNLDLSNGNYVLFHQLPNEIQDRCKVKEVNNKYRMTLTNIKTLQNAIDR